MPRTLLSHRYDKQMIRKEIEKRIIDVDISKQELADSIGMPYRTLLFKMSSGTWTGEDLFKIFDATQMPQSTILILFGRKEEK